MKLHITNILERAAERGYTPEEIRPCLTRDLGDGFYEVDVLHEAYPRTARVGYVPPPGLGDMVASWLKSFGVTKERVSAAVGRDCGCGSRQQAMNEWGRKYLGIG